MLISSRSRKGRGGGGIGDEEYDSYILKGWNLVMHRIDHDVMSHVCNSVPGLLRSVSRIRTVLSHLAHEVQQDFVSEKADCTLV